MIRWCLLAVGLIATHSAGCGAEQGAGSASVAGKVTYKGQPVEGRIVFYDPRGQAAFGSVAADGSYRLRANLGINRVTVASREPSKPNPDSGQLPRYLPGASRIPEKYDTPAGTGLTAVVNAGENRINFELED